MPSQNLIRLSWIAHKAERRTTIPKHTWPAYANLSTVGYIIAKYGQANAKAVAKAYWATNEGYTGYTFHNSGDPREVWAFGKVSVSLWVIRYRLHFRLPNNVRESIGKPKLSHTSHKGSNVMTKQPLYLIERWENGVNTLIGVSSSNMARNLGHNESVIGREYANYTYGNERVIAVLTSPEIRERA